MRSQSNLSDTSSHHTQSTRERSCVPLELAADIGLAKAVRMREALFNEDVLPPDFKPVAPRDFYAAVDLAAHRRRQQVWNHPGPGGKGSTRLPDRAA